MNTPDQPEQNDPLETLLRQPIAGVEDDGFAARVIESLPRRRREWLRTTILLGASAVGIVLAGQWLPWGSLPPFDVTDLFLQNPQQLGPWFMVIAVCSSLAWAVAAAVNGEADLI